MSTRRFTWLLTLNDSASSVTRTRSLNWKLLLIRISTVKYPGPTYEFRATPGRRSLYESSSRLGSPAIVALIGRPEPTVKTVDAVQLFTRAPSARESR